MNNASQEKGSTKSPVAEFSNLATRLAEIGRGFYNSGWNLGTSGNFSAVLHEDPLRMVITASGLDKGALTADGFLQIDERAAVVEGNGRPSAETSLHLSIVRLRKAKAVLHTHSVWSAILSEAYAEAGGLFIEGFEMLKGLEGI